MRWRLRGGGVRLRSRYVLRGIERVPGERERRKALLGIEYVKVAESTGRMWNPVEESGRRWKRWNSLHTTSISFYVTSP
jgi:hypothetical protein